MSDAALSAIQASFARLEAGQTDLRAALSEHRQQVDRSVTELRVALTDRVDRLQDVLTEHKQQVDRSATELRVALMDRVDRLQDSLTEHKQQVEQNATELRVALMDRMDRLQDTLSGIRDDVGVNMHHSDRVRQAHDHTREELRSLGDTVAVLHRRLRQLEDDVRTLKGDP